MSAVEHIVWAADVLMVCLLPVVALVVTVAVMTKPGAERRRQEAKAEDAAWDDWAKHLREADDDG